MAYCYVDNIDASLIVLHMLQSSSKYFPVPTLMDDEDLKYKLNTLKKLYTTWVDDNLSDSSYQSAIYKGICDMFAENVFWHAPLYLYTIDDEINTEMMWELKQLHPVYKVFSAFLNLNGFDEEKLMPYVDETFTNALIRRMENSCVETERDCVKEILFLLFKKAMYLRKYILQGTINSLLDYGHMSINTGVKELLELFKTLTCHRLVESPVIVKVVLCPLIKRKELCHYAGRLHECFETAIREVDSGLGVLFVDNAIDQWSASAADVPSLCRTFSALYFEACGPKERRQTHHRVVGHVGGCLLRAAAAAVMDGTTVAACQAYAKLCDRLIDDDDDEAAVDANDRDAMERVAEGLIAVHRYHGDYDCVHHAGHLLRRLISGERCLVGDACRLAALSVLVEDRPRTMTENLVDNTF
ncbi:hypothetical protein ACI65C_012739 [Semiaphis heraclei]